MQVLSPRVKELKEKHKDDEDTLNREAGCLAKRGEEMLAWCETKLTPDPSPRLLALTVSLCNRRCLQDLRNKAKTA